MNCVYPVLPWLPTCRSDTGIWPGSVNHLFSFSLFWLLSDIKFYQYKFDSVSVLIQTAICPGIDQNCDQGWYDLKSWWQRSQFQFLPWEIPILMSTSTVGISICTHTHTCMHTCIHTHACLYTHTHMHAYIRTHMHACTHTQIHTRTPLLSICMCLAPSVCFLFTFYDYVE